MQNASNRFTLNSASYISDVTLGVRVAEVSSDYGVHWAIGTKPFGRDIAEIRSIGDRTLIHRIEPVLMIDTLSYIDIMKARFEVDIRVAAGEYWVTVFNMGGTFYDGWQTVQGGEKALLTTVFPDDVWTGPRNYFKVEGQTLVSSVPEPSSALLLTAGLSILVIAASKAKHRP